MPRPPDRQDVERRWLRPHGGRRGGDHLRVAAQGWLNPMIAGAAMSLRSLSVIVNSSLLRRYRKASG